MLRLFEAYCAPLGRRNISEAYSINIWPLCGPDAICGSNFRVRTLGPLLYF